MILFSFPAFNWTKVELKLMSDKSIVAGMSSFNWTKVELKLGGIIKNNTSAVTFNWTKVELKLLVGSLITSLMHFF